MKFRKGTSEKVDDSKILSSDVVDYRVRCVVGNGPFDRLYYGITALEYHTGMSAEYDVRAKDVRTNFDHSAGRGLRPGRGVSVAPAKHFFTPGIGRKEEILLRRMMVKS